MTHHCHVPGCTQACPPRHLTCAAHWRLVPTEVQRGVYATVGGRGKSIDSSWAPWWRAQTKAIHAIMQAEGRDAEKLTRWLGREMKFADDLDGGGR